MKSVCCHFSFLSPLLSLVLASHNLTIGRMLSKRTLAALLPLFIASNALLFEPPSASAVKRHGQLSRRAGHGRRASGDGWVSSGCYTDNLAQRTLPAFKVASGTMTNDACKAICDEHGYAIAATEWSEECFCDDEFHNGGVKTADGECDMMCTGAPTEVCGGGLRLTVWTKQASVLESYGNWNSQGCFVDSVNARIVPNPVAVEGTFTPQKCMDSCAAQGYEYAGLEFSHECFCANGINTANLQQVDIGECNSHCDGDAAHYCGAGNRLNLYKRTTSTSVTQGIDGWTYDNCYGDEVANRALGLRAYVDGGMTPAKCTAKCFSLGYNYAGVEYSDECYCANSIGSSGTLKTDGCTMSCSGDRNAICGGSNRLTVYKYIGGELPGPASVLETYGDWNSAGCYIDSVQARVLTPNANAQRPMTVQNCIDACAAAGYTVAGLEYADECYCGLDLPSVSASDNCIMKCEGDAAHLCGGPNRLNVYQRASSTTTATDSSTSTSATDTTTSTSTQTNLPGATQSSLANPYAPWVYNNCKDSLSYQPGYQFTMNPVNTAATVQTCLTACQNYGLSVAQIGWGYYCTCGTLLGGREDLICNTPCRGNANEMCGGTSGGYATYTLPSDQTPLVMPTSDASWLDEGCYSAGGVYTQVLTEITDAYRMSPDRCTAACQAINMPVAVISSTTQTFGSSIQERQLCGCGNVLPTTRATADKCNKSCTAAGSQSQTCGSDFHYNVYRYAGTSAASTSTETSTSATTESSSTATATDSSSTTATQTGTDVAGATQTGAINPYDPWIEYGCYYPLSGSIEDEFIMNFAAPRIQTCLGHCGSIGLSIALLSEGNLCRCTALMPAAQATVCDMPCLAEDNEICGGAGGQASVFYLRKDKALEMPPANSGAQWSSAGCYRSSGEYQSGFGNDFSNSASMTPAKCTQACQAMNAPVAVLSSRTTQFLFTTTENQICGCGHDLPDQKWDDDSCNKPCTGDNSQNCGGDGFLSVWQLTIPSTSTSTQASIPTYTAD